MHQALLLHNDKAGAGKEQYSGEELRTMLLEEGFQCRLTSTDAAQWMDHLATVDLIIVAGGDGTIREVAKQMHELSYEHRKPIALLPMGTANNIARSLHLNGDVQTLMRRIDQWLVKKYDVGRIEGLTEHSFFLEAFGAGIFPALMRAMEQQSGEDLKTPEDRLRRAYEVMHDLVQVQEAFWCEIQLEDEQLGGSMLMFEAMNTPVVGPNLELAPQASPGDGWLQLAWVPASDRTAFAEFLLQKMNGLPTSYFIRVKKVKRLSVVTDAQHLHIDDQLIEHTENQISCTVSTGDDRLDFLVADVEMMNR